MAAVLLGATLMSSLQVPGSAALAGAVGQVLTPIQAVLTGVAARFGGAVGGARDLEDLRTQVKQLEAEKSVLQTQNTKLGELRRENDLLRRMNSFRRSRVDLDLRGASILGRKVAEEPGSLMHTIWLDIGSDQGVEKGVPVANDRGLVGQVIQVERQRASVRLILDSASQVAGRIQRSRATGMVVGSTTGQLVMRFIPQDLPGAPPNVQVGDIVATTGLVEEGLAQRFPPNLTIGQVIEVRQSDVETHQEAIVRPTVDFNALEFVMVVYGWTTDGRAAGASGLSGGTGSATDGTGQLKP